MKTFWAVKTPKGKLIHRSIGRTKTDCAMNAIWDGYFDYMPGVSGSSDRDLRKEAEKRGYKCVKVKIVQGGE